MKIHRKLTEAEEKIEGTEEIIDTKEVAPAEKKNEEKKEVVDVNKVMDLQLANRTPIIPSISNENTHDKDSLLVSAHQPMQSNDFLQQLTNAHNKQMLMKLAANQKNVQIAMTMLAVLSCSDTHKTPIPDISYFIFSIQITPDIKDWKTLSR